MLSNEWKAEIPLQMHRMGVRGLGPDGTPDWTAEFSLWLSPRRDSDDRPDDWEDRSIHDRRGPYQNSPARVRATRAFRKLRRQSNAEFIVAYRLCVLDPPTLDPRTHKPDSESFSGALNRTAHWLNERAVAKGRDERYSADDVAVLAYAAMDKLSRWSL
jgi:hypothetical protein